MKFILSRPSADDLIHLLKAWRFWLVGAVVGAVAGAAVYYVAPPPYRARATVNVDFHLEQAWPQNTDREQFYYLERETRKLEEIAVSDVVLNDAVTQVVGVTVQQMRDGAAMLSQPGNGGWHFFVDDRDPARAAALASAWARAFVEQVQEQVVTASTSGLEPYITASAVQTENLVAHRALSVSVYLLVGALGVLALGAFGVLFLDVNS